MPISDPAVGSFATATTSPLTSTLPAHSAGDCILLVAVNRQGPLAATVPAGYETIGVIQSTQFSGGVPPGHQVWIYGKIAGAAEADPQVSTASSVAAGWAIQTIVYSGVGAAILDSGLRWWANNFATGNVAPPTIRAGSDGARAVAFVASFDDNTLGLLAGSDQGYSLRASNNFNNQACLAIADKALTSAGDVQVGPTFEQTTVGPDAWIALGQLTLLPADQAPSLPRLMRQTIGDGSAVITQRTQNFDFSLLEAGDLIEVWIHTNALNPTITINNYTLEAYATGTTTRSCHLYYRIADGSETSVAITNAGGGAAWSFTTQIWRGVDTSTPFDVANTENNAASGATFAGPAVTPVTDGAVVQSMAGSQQAPTTPTFSNAQGFQAAFLERQWGTNESFDSTIFGADKYVATAAPTTAPTWSAGSSTWVGISTALRPVALDPPDAPTNPAATADSSSQITITWDDVADETGYRVERSADGTTGWADVSGNLAADTVSFANTGLTASTQYFYRVFAFNADGDSPASTVVNATTDAASGGGNRMGGSGAIRKPPRPSMVRR